MECHKFWRKLPGVFRLRLSGDIYFGGHDVGSKTIDVSVVTMIVKTKAKGWKWLFHDARNRRYGEICMYSHHPKPGVRNFG